MAERPIEIREKILNTIKKYNLISPNDTVLVAVSGGPDSMCLIDNLLALKDILKIKEIAVVHLNHMIRQEAKSETEYVQEYCKKNEIRCFVKYLDVVKIAEEEKIGTEEAGRKERYKFFDQVAQEINANKIAIAHNLNDNAETVLMHLLRGSGITGLCGIKPDREGKYIRPIIKCERAEIEQYCKDQKLDEKYDKTNLDNKYTRNRIRNELIPYIKKEFNPNIVEALDRLSDLITDEEQYMEKVTLEKYNEIVLEEENDKITIDLKKFNLLDSIIKARIIMYTIKKLFKTTKGIEKKHIEDIIKLCGNNIGNKYLTPNKNLKISIQNRKVYFEKV
jgi:tRNA(Ile)-lysidine synthase